MRGGVGGVGGGRGVTSTEAGTVADHTILPDSRKRPAIRPPMLSSAAFCLLGDWYQLFQMLLADGENLQFRH